MLLAYSGVQSKKLTAMQKQLKKHFKEGERAVQRRNGKCKGQRRKSMVCLWNNVEVWTTVKGQG